MALPLVLGSQNYPGRLGNRQVKRLKLLLLMDHNALLGQIEVLGVEVMMVTTRGLAQSGAAVQPWLRAVKGSEAGNGGLEAAVS